MTDARCDDCDLIMHGSITCNHPYIQLGSESIQKKYSMIFDTRGLIAMIVELVIMREIYITRVVIWSVVQNVSGQLLSCGCQYCECDDSTCPNWYSPRVVINDHAGATYKKHPHQSLA